LDNEEEWKKNYEKQTLWNEKRKLLWKLMFEDIKKGTKEGRKRGKWTKLMKLLLDEEKKKLLNKITKIKKTYKIAFLWF